MLENDFFTSRSEELLNKELKDIASKNFPKGDSEKIVSEDLEFLRKLTYFPEGTKLVMSKPFEQVLIIPKLV